MSAMNCEKFWELSEQWMDGERHADAVSHTVACGRCRTLIADLESIRQAGSALAAAQEQPSPHVWLAIRAQLEREGLIRPRRPGWQERFAGFGAFRPALAGAYLSLVIVGSVALSWHANTNTRLQDQAAWLSHTQAAMAPLEAGLTSAETTNLPAMKAQNLDVTATLNHNLAIVDNMISMCEKSVREDPQNEMTRDYLYTAYQQKADLLATMAESEGR
ncbi:MAG TPA: hypothetical protein VGU63_15595 [Candidatus Acidoferrales bacterium]|nr:hypothetical protein [Candidatus Acidoferrales bacterium]